MATGPGGIIPGNYNASQLTQDQRNWLFNYFGHSGNAPSGYGGENAPGEMSNYTVGESPTDASAQNAQDYFKQQSGQAVQGLQTQKSNLAQQYSDLLKTVTGIYTPLINQETATAGAAEAARGLTPDSQLFQQNVQGALAPVYGQEAANAQTIGQGSITDTNTLAQAIANLQVGAAGTGAGIAVDYATLANALAVGSLQNLKPFAVGNLVYNPATNSFSTPSTNSPASSSSSGAATGTKSNAVGNPSPTKTPTITPGVQFTNSLNEIQGGINTSSLFGNNNILNNGLIASPNGDPTSTLLNPSGDTLTAYQKQILGMSP